MEILVFGDSIAYGAWDKEGGWVSRVRRMVDEKILSTTSDDYYHHLYNLGVSGDTSLALLNRFKGEMDARLLKEKDCAVIFAIGANDSQFFFASKENKTSLPVFEKNILTLINNAREYTEKTAFVGLMPVDETKVNPVPWAPEKAFTNLHISQFNDSIKAICAKEKITFIDVHTAFSEKNPSHLLEDGVHPNNAGHQAIANIVQDNLEKLGWI